MQCAYPLGERGGAERGMVFSDAGSGGNEAGIREAFRAVNVGIGRRERYRSRVMEEVVFKDSRCEPLRQGVYIAAYMHQKGYHDNPSLTGLAQAPRVMHAEAGDGICGFGRPSCSKIAVRRLRQDAQVPPPLRSCRLASP